MIYVNTQLSVRRSISSVSLATKVSECAAARPGEPSWSESGVSVFVVCVYNIFCGWRLFIPHHLILHFHSTQWCGGGKGKNLQCCPFDAMQQHTTTKSKAWSRERNYVHYQRLYWRLSFSYRTKWRTKERHQASQQARSSTTPPRTHHHWNRNTTTRKTGLSS